MDSDKLIENLVSSVKKQVKLDQVHFGKSDVFGIKRWLKTGIWSVDWILGGRGLPYGRLVEVYGDFSSGKSWFAYVTLAEAQKAGDIAVLIETEHSYDPEYAKLVGVDVDKLILILPGTVEEAFSAISALYDELEKSGEKVSLVTVWDSIAATPTDHEIKEGMGTKDMSKAGKMGQGLRLITKKVEDNAGIFIAVNQLRDKIGVMFGEKEFTPGGRALDFHTSVRLKMSKAGKIFLDESKKEKEVIGQTLKIECTKSKVCVPFKSVKLNLIPGKVVVPWEGVLGILQKKGLVVDTRGWNQFIGDIEKWRESQFEEVIQKNEIGKKIIREFLNGSKED